MQNTQGLQKGHTSIIFSIAITVGFRGGSRDDGTKPVDGTICCDEEDIDATAVSKL